jgi:hypothetical protein
MAFLLPDGTLSTVRCGCPNLCAFCAFMSAAEDGMMVLQDALDGTPPRVSMTLTTARPTTPPHVFRRDVEQVFKLIRRRCPDAEYLGRIEFTTGKGARSGGHRRIHQHMLLKHVAASETASIEGDVRELWRRRTGAHRIEVAELRSAAGAAHYLTHHHSKADQAPSKGWRGRRLRASRGYFELPAVDRREQAREALRDRRVVKRFEELLQAQDVEPMADEFEEWVAPVLENAAEAAIRTRLVRVAELPTEFGPDGLPTGWQTEILGDVHA